MPATQSALSVIVACFHTHEWVVRAVTSALRQTVSPLEILLVSDDQRITCRPCMMQVWRLIVYDSVILEKQGQAVTKPEKLDLLMLAVNM